jgi:twinkle protein
MALLSTYNRITINHGPCPICPSSDAYTEWEDGHGHCFSCDYHKSINGDNLSYTYEYLPWRGLTRNTLEKYDILTKIDEEGRPISIGFKYPDGKVKVRSLDEKSFRWEPKGDTSKTGLFGRDKFSAGTHKWVAITEGEVDAATIFQVMGVPAVSIHSATTAARDCAADRSWLNSFEKIYLCLDADASGRDAQLVVAKLFDYNKILVVDFGNRKDANEYLEAGEEDDLRNLWWNAKRFLPETIISSFSEFRKILAGKPKRGVLYPFPKLNEMTNGIRKGETVLITGMEGIGKTELLHAIEYKLLKETEDGIGAIFLEEPKRDHLSSIASMELKKPVFYQDSGVSGPEVIDAVEKSVGKDDRLHLYNHFGSDDPDIFLDTIRFMAAARNVGFIFLDHIGLCVSGLAGEDERKALDYISTRLEMMVKELEFSLIMVSHVNDQRQTRGSRLISKNCDIRIDAERDILNSDDRIKNTINLTVTKNRPPMGKTGFAGSLLFDPYTRQYTEINEAA